jgi:hypothetical protein
MTSKPKAPGKKAIAIPDIAPFILNKWEKMQGKIANAHPIKKAK